ncbi:MAG: hypothetical protein KME27_10255 [Lyngbya sp. HA4199-MV5]|nr:hypothetical protein [Lyngbya sp. HA4199-MV5]
MTVPDQDTTVSAYGGALRRYDIHIAKMFEVTHYLCQQEHKPNQLEWIKYTLFSDYSSPSGRLKLLNTFLQNRLNEKGFEWSYGAANDNVDMGRFKISCQLASEVAEAYGLDQARQTEIKIRKTESTRGRYLKEYMIPPLNTVDAKVSKWMDFVQRFRPISFFRLPEFRAFQTSEAMLKLANKTEIPIFLPSKTSFYGRNLEIIADAESYYVGVYVGPAGCGEGCRSTASYQGAISAGRRKVIDKPTDKKMSEYPNSTFREIQLVGGMTGTYSSICGAYCMGSVDWEYQGISYSVIEKGGGQRALVEMANSAIAAGPR